MKSPSPLLRFFLMLCFAGSGLLSLNYEILWLRKLHSLMGSTSLATTAILSAFMGGLALGAWLAGKYLLNTRSPLRIYGLLELGIAIYAVLSPWLFAQTGELYLWLQPSLPSQPWALPILRTAIASLLLILPTTAMGATLPVLVAGLSPSPQTTEAPVGTVGLLYGLNTLGAVAGTLLTGFVLLPVFGQAQSLSLTAWSNLGLGGLLLCLPSHWLAPNPAPLHTGSASTKTFFRPSLAIAALTGCTAMVLETSWTRLLSQNMGSTTYAFGLMLATYLSALALGSLCFHRQGERSPEKISALTGLLLSVAGLCTLLSQWLLNPSPTFYSQLSAALSPVLDKHSASSHLLSQAGIAILMIFAPVFFLGALFPLLNSWSTQTGHSSAQASAQIYTVNTLAGVGGTWLASFVLGPRLGFYPSLTLGALVLLGAGLLTLHLNPTASHRARLIHVGLLLTGLGLWLKLPPQEHRFHLLELYHSPHLVQDLKNNPHFQALFSRFQTRYAKDGLSASVSVIELDQTQILLTDGKTDASSEISVIPLALSHLPLLFRPQTEEILIIGLGSGITAGAAALHPLKSIDVVEIEKEVVQASLLFFQKPARSALSDPRVHLQIEDAATFLSNRLARYDLIVSQSSHPWRAGSARLFTTDFWQTGKKALRPGGVFVQWLGLRHMQPRHLQSVLKSFQAVYPESRLFIYEAEIILLGSDRPLIYYPQSAQGVWKIASADLQRIHSDKALSADNLLLGFLANTEQIQKMGQPGQYITEDNGLLEFQLPWELQNPNTEKLKASLGSQNRQPLKTELF